MKSYFVLAVRLALIVAAVVLMLAVVNHFTAEKITAAEEAEGVHARSALLPDAVFTKLSSDVIDAAYADTVTAVYRAENGAETVGYFMDVTVSGYGGDIKMVVGLNPDLTLIGVRVISHSETSGIGSRAVDENGALISQFKGKSAAGVADADGISGATISSKAVKNGVLAACAVAESLEKEASDHVG